MYCLGSLLLCDLTQQSVLPPVSDSNVTRDFKMYASGKHNKVKILGRKQGSGCIFMVGFVEAVPNHSSIKEV